MEKVFKTPEGPRRGSPEYPFVNEAKAGREPAPESLDAHEDCRNVITALNAELSERPELSELIAILSSLDLEDEKVVDFDNMLNLGGQSWEAFTAVDEDEASELVEAITLWKTAVDAEGKRAAGQKIIRILRS